MKKLLWEKQGSIPVINENTAYGSNMAG